VCFGYAMGQFMPFIAGGAAVSDTRITFRDTTPNENGSGATVDTKTLTRVGLTVGGGVDWMFAPNWIGRLEYLYDQYGSVTYALRQNDSEEGFDLRSHIVRAALMYKFESPAAPYPAGLITKAPPVAYPAQWSGVYLGVFAGGHWSRNLWTSDETEPADFPGVPAFQLKGFSGGGLIGANFQQGSFVWGPELDLGALTGSTTLDAAAFPETPAEERDIDSLELRARWNAHARIRFGYAMGQVLPFLAAGVAFANTSVTFRHHATPGDLNRRPLETKRLDHVGATIGGGIDFMLAPNWIGRVEYLYDHYAPTGFGSVQRRDLETFELTSHTARAALMYQFGAGVLAAPYPGGMVTKAPQPVYPAPWAGVYAGLFAGGHASRDSWNSDETDPAAAFGPFDLHLRGFAGGALIGANVQHGNIVWGPELDAGWMGGSTTFGDLRRFVPSSIDSLDIESRWNAHARVRFGYAIGQAMPFIAGGAAFANTKVIYRDSADATPVAGADLTHVGVTVGGGLDWMFTRNWIGRVEYLYDHYAPASFGLGAQTNVEFYELRSQTVRGAIVYKWDSAPVIAKF
jgi:outer membrane immunogenic protein